MQASQWDSYEKRKKESSARGRLRGRGMATYIEATGAGFSPQDQIEMRWDKEGGLTLFAPTHNHGQGHETTFAQITHQVLGVPVEKVKLRTAGADFYLLGNATGGSRSLAAVGSVVMLAGQDMVT